MTAISLHKKIDEAQPPNDISVQDKEKNMENSLTIPKHVKGEKLPNTATPWYNVLLLSIVLLISSGGL